MSAPRVSILMPMRDAADFVAEALGSILVQTGPSLEVVVVDDGSRDGSGDVVRALKDSRVRVIAGPERGIAAALNAGLGTVRGDIVMRCDADDRYLPGRLERQVGLLDAHPEIGAVAGGYHSMDPAGRLAAVLCQELPDGDITDIERTNRSGTHLCTFAIRIGLLRELGGFREAFVTAEDIDLKLRLAEITRIWFDRTPVYEYRLHDSSITHVQGNARRAYYYALARQCQRERAECGTDCVARGELPALPSGGDAPRRSAEHVRDHLVAQAWRCHRAGDWKAGLGFGLKAAMTKPSDLGTWRSVAALALKRSG